ncbi:hypothetical protein GCWU000341_00207 [Oribacterium sp. oral taxon 078 str. F0262]|nr:hypothetical protein GCWU000341_00207 [Oribacterium sp. oral taxon 078 str. F0262]
MKSELVKIISVSSLPARGAWIEISCPQFDNIVHLVAPREGSVD